MKTRKTKPKRPERRWLFFSNGSLHGICHSEVVVVRSNPGRSLTRNSLAVFTISRAAILAALAVLLVAVVVALAGCQSPRAQQGGAATTLISRAGGTNSATLRQSENPREPSRQTMESEQTIEYLVPSGTLRPAGQAGMGEDSCQSVGVAGALFPSSHAVPVRVKSKDRTETFIGGAQKDTAREWASKAAQIRPVIWGGIAMMTVVAGVLIYFGWWTKAALAAGVGAGMIVLAQTLPQYGAVILLAGLALFGVVALLVLYAYYKGQIDTNQNGIPDFFEKDRTVPF